MYIMAEARDNDKASIILHPESLGLLSILYGLTALPKFYEMILSYGA